LIKIKWFGHSMWKVWNDDISIVIDPFEYVGYKLPENETADLILSSHDHFDHNNFSLIQGDPQIFDQPGEFEYRSVKIKNIPVWHDDTEGSQRGSNLLMKFTVSGKNFLHCGDLGHIPRENILAELGKIDVLFVPIGGFYTIDASQAKKIVELISPVIVFPMHYKTAVLDFPIATSEPYLEMITDLKVQKGNIITLNKDDFQSAKTIILDYE